MEITKTDSLIQGVEITPLKVIKHPQGDLYKAITKSAPGYQGFGEAYFSTVHKDQIKPWRKHFKATCNLTVPVGEVRFVMIDDREESKTYGYLNEFSLSLDNYVRLTIAPGIWMAFQGKNTQNMVMNFSNLEHDPEESIKADIEAFPFTLST